ncbi:UPF0276 protein [Cellvibrio zantedeschiae]|uniref:UPF0276 protein n=1 Tax=Cellvibrio zantedeschiae TaxID=1237077 RepID=A0ABQ3B3E9_9GAMM|nr:DUF692 domain-containing protein [Cellvibrio zantedeschiae]GGY77039.1 UPF0276 protein [Cellvibrio zantedeschiae]
MMVDKNFSASVSGAGLGLHRSLLDKLNHLSAEDINFLEVAPENWINVGGRLGKQLRSYTEKFPFVCHGLSLSLGAPAPLNIDLLKAVKVFLRQHKIHYYSEHLSYSGDAGNLFELLPIPFTEDAVHYVASRIRQAQDILGQRIAIENATYYYAPQQEMAEWEFINAVMYEADCALLLDVNNLYVNSVNHQYDALEFLQNLHGERTAYIHIAGHDTERESFYTDTHGAPVVKDVWSLLQLAYSLFGVRPTLLERENNIPPINALLQEINQIMEYQTLSSSQKT